MERAASPLLTDLYELTMLQAYWREGMDGQAVFEFFVRALPPGRQFLVAAGLAQVLDFLETLAFDDADLGSLRALGRFDESFLDALARLRFAGDVDAVPEGTLVFAGEPLLRLHAPLRQAQLVESRLVNLLHFQTMVASKAVRSVLAARGKRLVDFGMRRAHGAEAALLSARASYLAGFDGTATVEAGVRFGIPLFGTMAHSFVQAHASEAAAFVAYARAFPAHVTWLVDTYDVAAAARTVAQLAPRLAREGATIEAVRIDSGDLGAMAREVRAILDAAGCGRIGIFASGNLDEDRITALERERAPIDGYGVGTRMNTSADCPYLDCAYKLVEYDSRPTLKLSSGKATWPGAKQVFRRFAADGRIQSDCIGLRDETGCGVPLLVPVMRNGRRLDTTTRPAAAAQLDATAPLDAAAQLGPAAQLAAARALVRAQLQALPATLLQLDATETIPVHVSAALQSLAAQVHAGLARGAAHA